MMRSISLINIFAAMALAAPAAMAGTDIVKCVDPDGRVTLTDQPCAAGATGVRLAQASMGADSSDNGQDNAQDKAQNDVKSAVATRRHVLPAADVRQGPWHRPDLSRPAPLNQDVATLKAARRMLMLQDARPTLAGLP
jgi:hypothetical protein